MHDIYNPTNITVCVMFELSFSNVYTYIIYISDATSILRIDPVKDEATTFAKLSDTKNKWQGGVLSPIDKCVYAVPADSDCILRIDTDPDTPLKVDTTIGTEFLSGSSISSNDLTDKWQGGFLARDGNIYGIPVSERRRSHLYCRFILQRSS